MMLGARAGESQSVCLMAEDKKPFNAKHAEKGAKFAKRNLRSKGN